VEWKWRERVVPERKKRPACCNTHPCLARPSRCRPPARHHVSPQEILFLACPARGRPPARHRVRVPPPALIIGIVEDEVVVARVVLTERLCLRGRSPCFLVRLGRGFRRAAALWWRRKRRGCLATPPGCGCPLGGRRPARAFGKVGRVGRGGAVGAAGGRLTTPSTIAGTASPPVKDAQEASGDGEEGGPGERASVGGAGEMRVRIEDF